MPGRGTPANPNGARTAKPSLRHDNRLSLTTHLPRCLLGRWPRKNLPARGIHTPRQPGFRWAEFGVAVLGFAPRPYGRFALYEVVRRRTNRLKQPVASDTRRNDSKRSEKTGDWATQAPLGTPASTGSKNLRSRHFETYASNPSCQMGTLEKMGRSSVFPQNAHLERSVRCIDRLHKWQEPHKATGERELERPAATKRRNGHRSIVAAQLE